MKPKDIVLTLALIGSLAGAKIAKAINIDGFFINDSCSVKVFRNPTAGLDTLLKETDKFGYWGIDHTHFGNTPPLSPGDTLYIEGDRLGRKAKTLLVFRGPPEDNHTNDLNLNHFTACIRNVMDSSQVNAPLKAIYWINNNNPETTAIDTFNVGWTFYYDVHVPFDTAQATPGANGHIRLEKTLNDTTWFRNLAFTVDRTRFDAQLIRDTLKFGRDSCKVFCDVGIDSLLLDSVYNYGTIIIPQAKVRNLGHINQRDTLLFRISKDGNTLYTSDTVVTLPGDSNLYTISFRPCTLNTEGTLLAVCKSILQGDTNTGNDSAYKNIRVRSQEIPDTNDIGIEDILSPTGTLYLGNSVIPKTIIKNFGNVTKNSFKVIYTIGLSDIKSGEFVDTLFVDSLQPGEIDTLEFYNYIANTLGIFATRAQILPGDDNPSNDTMSGAGFEVVESIIQQPPTPGWHKDTLAVVPTQDPRGRKVKGGGSLVAIVNSDKGLEEIYAFKGYNSNEFYAYNPSQNTWTLKESIPFASKPTDPTKINKKRVDKGASLAYDGLNTIYATKGKGTFELWNYNIDQDTWIFNQFVPSAKGLKGGTSMAFKDGKLYILAGGQKIGYDNFFVYDDSTGEINPLSDAPITPDNKKFSDGSSIVAKGDSIFALKGKGRHNYFYAYDINTGIWGEPETIPLVHPQLGRKTKVGDGGAMTEAQGNIYATKGKGKQDFWKYSGSIWIDEDTIPRSDRKAVPKTGAALTAINDKIYLMLGNNTDKFLLYQIGALVNKNPGSNLITPLQLAGELENKVTGHDLKLRRNIGSNFYFNCINYQDKERTGLRVFNVSGSFVKEFYSDNGNWEVNGLIPGAYFAVLGPSREKFIVTD